MVKLGTFELYLQPDDINLSSDVMIREVIIS